jgi:hypothetical protein
MNAAYAQVRAAAAAEHHTEHYTEAVATEFAHAAEVLHTATRSWPVLPPCTRSELDAVGHQLEGLRRALGDMRMALQK